MTFIDQHDEYMNWSLRFALIHTHINVISIFCSLQMNWNGHFWLCSAFHSPISIQHFHISNIQITRNKKEYLHLALCFLITAFFLSGRQFLVKCYSNAKKVNWKWILTVKFTSFSHQANHTPFTFGVFYLPDPHSSVWRVECGEFFLDWIKLHECHVHDANTSKIENQFHNSFWLAKFRLRIGAIVENDHDTNLAKTENFHFHNNNEWRNSVVEASKANSKIVII